MFDLGIGELLLIGIVALIVVGPKDLPVMFRNVGRFTGKMKGMAREFTRAMNAAADESGMREISSSLKAAANPTKFGTEKLKEATGVTKGPETKALSEERQSMKEKMSNAMAKAATDRQLRDTASNDQNESPVASKDDA